MEEKKEKLKLFIKRERSYYVIISAIIAIGIALDQLTKWLSVWLLKPVSSVPIIKDVIHLTYVENPGAAFGMMKDSRWIFLISSTVAIILFIGFLYLGHAKNMLYVVSLSMIASGGIGNMIDRLALGYVVDFIDFTLIDFAVFNGADSFVCVGAGILVIAMTRDLIEEIKKERAEKEAKELSGESSKGSNKSGK